MMRPSSMPLRLPVLFALLAGALLVLGTAGPAAAEKEREDVANNFILRVPDAWTWSEAGSDWEKLGIKIRGYRRLDKLKRAGTPSGEGGEVMVSVLDAPAGKSLDDLAADAQHRQFLLGRFGEDPAKWPTPEVEKGSVAPEDQGPEVETRVLYAVGDARNLDGNLNKSKGALLLAVVRGKLFRVRMYAWHTPYDDEGLRDDITWIELNFGFLTTKEEKPKEGPRPPPSEDDPGEKAPEFEGDGAEEKVIENVVQKWRLTKPKGIQSKEIDRDTYPTQMVFFEGSHELGSYQIILDVFAANAVNAQGQRYGDVDIKGWNSTKWWPIFLSNHPEGELFTLPWPKKTKNRTFLTLPDAEGKPETVVKADAKRPPDPTYGDLEKLGVVEKVKAPRLGKGEPSEAFRGVLVGNRPRIGKEVVMRFSWRTQSHSYELTVSLTGDILKKHGERIRTLLESIELLDK